MKKRSKVGVENDAFDRQIDWELRPGGMLVQKRDIGDASSGPMIKIKVSHGSYYHDVIVHAQSTFGNHLFNFIYFLGSSYFLSHFLGYIPHSQFGFFFLHGKFDNCHSSQFHYFIIKSCKKFLYGQC